MTCRNLALLCAFCAAAAPVAAQPSITALLREGDAVGPSPHVVTSVGSVRTNHAGGFAAGPNTSDGAGTTLSHVWGSATGGPGAVLQTEGTFGSLVQTAFEGFFGISDAGVAGYSATGTGGPVGGFDSLWIGNDPIAVEGNPVPPLPGQFWVFASRPGMTATGEAWWVSGFGPATTTTNRALCRATTAANVSIVLKGGDFVTGIADAVSAATSVQFPFRVSELGTNWIGEVGFAGAAATSNAMVINNAVAIAGGSPIREGTVVPVAAGGNGVEIYQTFDNNGINEAGNWIITGDTNAATGVDAFVMVNGNIVLREGQMLGGFPLLGTQDGADINEQGDWAVLWAVTVAGVSRECVIYNGQLMVKETDPIDFNGDGVPDAGFTLTDIIGIDNIAISDRGPTGTVDVYFSGDTGGGQAVYRIRIPGICVADVDDGSGTGTPDGGVGIEDLLYYLDLYDDGLLAADVDDGSGTGTTDGGVGIEDLLYYLLRYDGGC